MQSVFADMTAEEALAHHKKTLLALRVQHIAMVLVLGAMALFAVEKGAPVLYLFGLAGIIATFLLFFYRLTQAVSQFQDILWQDADVAKYRAALEAYADVAKYRAALEAYYGQTKNRSTRNMLELELAFCDYFDGLDDAALERLARLTFKGRKSTQRLRSLNLQVLLYNAQNDTVRRDEALDRIRTMAARYRAGSKLAATATNLVRDLELRCRPVEQWSEEDARYIREQMGLADKNLNRIGLRLRLDAYELAHGRLAEVARDLAALGEEPIVPRYETMRLQLLHKAERQAFDE